MLTFLIVQFVFDDVVSVLFFSLVLSSILEFGVDMSLRFFVFFFLSLRVLSRLIKSVVCSLFFFLRRERGSVLEREERRGGSVCFSLGRGCGWRKEGFLERLWARCLTIFGRMFFFSGRRRLSVVLGFFMDFGATP